MKWCGIMLTGKPEVPGERPVPMSLCPPQIPHGWPGIELRPVW